jgi:hypothetical protein
MITNICNIGRWVITGVCNIGRYGVSLQSCESRLYIICSCPHHFLQSSKIVAKLCCHHNKGQSPIIQHLFQLCCSPHNSFDGLIQWCKQALGDVAVVTTDLVAKQAKSRVEGVQLGLYQGQCCAEHHCKFGVNCGHGSLKFCIKQSFKHFAVVGIGFTLPFP